MSTTTGPEYLTCAETAKLVRIALKNAHPATRFSVKSHTYAGGASINVSWTDGPTEMQVDETVAGFVGGGFDGMIDLAYNVDSWLLPDGTAHLAHSPGTEGSRGMHPEYIGSPGHPGARLVSFGADHVFTRRETSPERVAQLAEQVSTEKVGFIEWCAGCGSERLGATAYRHPGIAEWRNFGPQPGDWGHTPECAARIAARWIPA